MIRDIIASARALPLGVQIWIFGILVPVNFAAAIFWSLPFGVSVAVLAIGGIAPNGVLMLVERGFSRAMAFSHLVIWPGLLGLILWMLASLDLSDKYRAYLIALFAVNAVSMVFDIRDALRWIRGDRNVAGR